MKKIALYVLLPQVQVLKNFLSELKSLNGLVRRVLSNKKIRIDIRRRLYQAIAVDIALWGSDSLALREKDRSKLQGECLAHGVQHDDQQGECNKHTPSLHNYSREAWF
jgi:hypothetical protein